MNYADLKTLIDSEPANAARTDQEVLDWCNTPTIVRDQEKVSTEDVFTECLRESAEWDLLSADDRQIVRDICTVYEGVPTQSGDPARTVLINVLGTNTKAAIAALIPETVSPAVDDGLGVVNLGDVQNARAL